jgi:hypothetical protein
MAASKLVPDVDPLLVTKQVWVVQVALDFVRQIHPQTVARMPWWDRAMARIWIERAISYSPAPGSVPELEPLIAALEVLDGADRGVAAEAGSARG